MSTTSTESLGNSALSDSSTNTKQLIKQLAELLPSQGPITAFAFLNPLQGLEDKPFFEVLEKVGEVFGCEPLLQEADYRQKLAQGRITKYDLLEVVAEEPLSHSEQLVGGLIRYSDLRMSMLEHSLNPGSEQELHWIIGETDALSRFRGEISHNMRERLIDATREWTNKNFSPSNSANLWWSQEAFRKKFRAITNGASFDAHSEVDESTWEAVCLSLLWEIVNQRMQTTPNGLHTKPAAVRHRDLLYEVSMSDSDALVHEVLIRFCAAYLDQGFSHWRLPDRNEGFFKSFIALFCNGGTFSKRWIKPLIKEARRIKQAGISASESIEESLKLLGVEDSEKEVFLRSSMLALRGWAGMIWQTETRPDRVFVASPEGTLVDYLAVRFLLDRFAIQAIAKDELGFTGELAKLRDHLRGHLPESHDNVSASQRAYPVFELAQLHGWTPQMMAELPANEWKELVHAIEQFSSFDRRRVLHLAFERNFSRRALNAIVQRASEPMSRPANPRFQVVTCIDTREESFRRHLEEVAPDVETFGNAGFFCIPMYYRGAGDAHFSTLCPIVIKPQHWIVEDVVHSLADSHRQRAMARKVLGKASHQFNSGTRGSVTGAVLTAAFGPLFTIPLVGRILFPRTAAKMHRAARGFVLPPPVTRLRLERPEGTPPSPTEDGIGFTLTEMVNMSERSLRDIGLTSNFARLVLILGHGSNCLNNPHESAYHCGACSGSPGGANGRALAAMCNDPRVRKQLATRGLVIPDETHFLGGLHNTATEEITFFDLELLPTSHVRDLRKALDTFSHVAERNSHERCRRFESAPLDISPLEALRHVENRAEDLAQTRPEYGNSTNAVCFVGRRSRIRGLYLDRRCFLMSYDATQDTEVSMILARILGAVIPVCEGINMLYTLSTIDPRGWGCSTKLPHNVTSLLGVMDGAASDLRPGLPWQGCDIHEPMRLLFVIESTPEALLRIMDQNPMVGKICRNGWAQLAVLDPHSNRIQRFLNGKFEEYNVPVTEIGVSEGSIDWYRGHRENLPFALIRENAST